MEAGIILTFRISEIAGKKEGLRSFHLETQGMHMGSVSQRAWVYDEKFEVSFPEQ